MLVVVKSFTSEAVVGLAARARRGRPGRARGRQVLRSMNGEVALHRPDLVAHHGVGPRPRSAAWRSAGMLSGRARNGAQQRVACPAAPRRRPARGPGRCRRSSRGWVKPVSTPRRALSMIVAIVARAGPRAGRSRPRRRRPSGSAWWRRHSSGCPRSRRPRRSGCGPGRARSAPAAAQLPGHVAAVQAGALSERPAAGTAAGGPGSAFSAASRRASAAGVTSGSLGQRGAVALAAGGDRVLASAARRRSRRPAAFIAASSARAGGGEEQGQDEGQDQAAHGVSPESAAKLARPAPGAKAWRRRPRRRPWSVAIRGRGPRA